MAQDQAEYTTKASGGFQSPNYTQTPNDLFDELLPFMGLAELKVVMCIVRHTFGYHKDNVKLSLRTIARFTGLTANSVMEGAKQAEAHGLIERWLDGNKTTTWTAIVSVVPTDTRRISSRYTRVSPTKPLSGVKESKESKKNGASAPKPDIVDFEISKLPAKSIRQAVHEYFRLNTNWETKYNRQWMEWAVEQGVTAEQIKRAADTWRSDKLFNWQPPTLKGIFEKWQMLMDASSGAAEEKTRLL
jgi:hypothetical protein